MGGHGWKAVTGRWSEAVCAMGDGTRGYGWDVFDKI